MVAVLSVLNWYWSRYHLQEIIHKNYTYIRRQTFKFIYPSIFNLIYRTTEVGTYFY